MPTTYSSVRMGRGVPNTRSWVPFRPSQMFHTAIEEPLTFNTTAARMMAAPRRNRLRCSQSPTMGRPNENHEHTNVQIGNSMASRNSLICRSAPASVRLNTFAENQGYALTQPQLMMAATSNVNAKRTHWAAPLSHLGFSRLRPARPRPSHFELPNVFQFSATGFPNTLLACTDRKSHSLIPASCAQ